jgi:hypothetical protein
MCVSGDETEVRDDLFPRQDDHEKVRRAAKFVGTPVSLLGMRPSRLLISKETRQ